MTLAPAADAVDAEVTATGQRIRAIERRSLPRLCVLGQVASGKREREDGACLSLLAGHDAGP